jgi:hypothetical protein
MNLVNEAEVEEEVVEAEDGVEVNIGVEEVVKDSTEDEVVVEAEETGLIRRKTKTVRPSVNSLQKTLPSTKMVIRDQHPIEEEEVAAEVKAATSTMEMVNGPRSKRKMPVMP